MYFSVSWFIPLFLWIRRCILRSFQFFIAVVHLALFAARPFKYGAMVKWLRHGPFTAVTGVRIPVASPCSIARGMLIIFQSHYRVRAKMSLVPLIVAIAKFIYGNMQIWWNWYTCKLEVLVRYSHGGSSPPICTIFKNGTVLKWWRELTRNQLGTKVREGSNPSGSATYGVIPKRWRGLIGNQIGWVNLSAKVQILLAPPFFYGVVLKLVKRVDC